MCVDFRKEQKAQLNKNISCYCKCEYIYVTNEYLHPIGCRINFVIFGNKTKQCSYTENYHINPCVEISYWNNIMHFLSVLHMVIKVNLIYINSQHKYLSLVNQICFSRSLNLVLTDQNTTVIKVNLNIIFSFGYNCLITNLN